MLGCEPERELPPLGLSSPSEDFFFNTGPPLVVDLSISVLVELDRLLIRLFRRLSTTVMGSVCLSPGPPLACLGRMTSDVCFGSNPLLSSVLKFLL